MITIDTDKLIEFIAERSDVDRREIREVLDFQDEYLRLKGVIIDE